jgi:hypothetical protein
MSKKRASCGDVVSFVLPQAQTNAQGNRTEMGKVIAMIPGGQEKEDIYFMNCGNSPSIYLCTSIRGGIVVDSIRRYFQAHIGYSTSIDKAVTLMKKVIELQSTFTINVNEFGLSLVPRHRKEMFVCVDVHFENGVFVPKAITNFGSKSFSIDNLTPQGFQEAKEDIVASAINKATAAMMMLR